MVTCVEGSASPPAQSKRHWSGNKSRMFGFVTAGVGAGGGVGGNGVGGGVGGDGVGGGVGCGAGVGVGGRAPDTTSFLLLLQRHFQALR